MFVYEEDARLYWFNRSSLENEREFELIGIILGAAIYNGVILDARFPHVVYKKLMGQPVGLADLKRAFPPLARGFEQLLEYANDDVESAFGLCMQVNFEEFGQTRTYDLMLNGGGRCQQRWEHSVWMPCCGLASVAERFGTSAVCVCQISLLVVRTVKSTYACMPNTFSRTPLRDSSALSSGVSTLSAAANACSCFVGKRCVRIHADWSLECSSMTHITYYT